LIITVPGVRPSERAPQWFVPAGGIPFAVAQGRRSLRLKNGYARN
jgi:hypothetical protein